MINKVISGILNLIKDSLLTKRVRISQHNVLVFLPEGGSAISPSERGILIDYLKQEVPNCQFFSEEDVFQLMNGNNTVHLGNEEVALETYADCIVILGKQGKKGGLGRFAQNERFLPPTLWAQFISLFSKKHRSPFRKSIVFHTLDDLAKLLRLFCRERNPRELTRGQYDLTFSSQEKLLFLADMIWIFSPVTKGNLKRYLSYILDSPSETEIDNDLDFLTRMGIVNRIKYDNDIYYYRAIEKKETLFCKFYGKSNPVHLRKEFLLNFRRNNKVISEVTKAIYSYEINL